MKSMLYLVAKLSQYSVRNVARVLCYEVDAYALGPDELDNLLYLIKKSFGCTIKEKMSFIEEEYELGLIKITNFRQVLKKF